MRRLLENKWMVVALALAGLVGLGLLAAALREVEFQPAGPLPLSFASSPVIQNASSNFDLPFIQWIALIAIVALVLALILSLINPKTRKRVLLLLLRYALTMLCLWWLFERSGLRFNRDAPPTGDAAAPASFPNIPQSSAATFSPPQVNPWVGFIVSFVVALVIVAVVWLILRRSQPRKALVFDRLAEIAQQALDGLQDGHNWDDAIVAAYIRMNEVVTAERGLIRQPATTPTEFAIRMEKAGLPGEAARTLTRLFEQVRYGAQSSTRQERDLAAAALGAILRACGVKQ